MATKELTILGGVDGGIAIAVVGKILYVDAIHGSATRGLVAKTVQQAVDRANPGDVVCITPGSYAENVVIPAQKPRLTLIGCGDRHTADLTPVAGVPLIVHADDTRLINFDCEAPAGSAALRVYGSRCRALRCKLEGGLYGLQIGPRLVVDGGRGGADALFEDCEFGWLTNGVELVGSDYGAATQIRFRRCLFHNIVTDHFAEGHLAGGAAFDHFRNLEVVDCVFQRAEDGTAPAHYVNLAANVANTGVFADNRFSYATNAAGVFVLAAGTLWVRNATEAGSSAARPA